MCCNMVSSHQVSSKGPCRTTSENSNAGADDASSGQPAAMSSRAMTRRCKLLRACSNARREVRNTSADRVCSSTPPLRSSHSDGSGGPRERSASSRLPRRLEVRRPELSWVRMRNTARRSRSRSVVLEIERWIPWPVRTCPKMRSSQPSPCCHWQKACSPASVRA